MCEARSSSRANSLNTFKSAHALIINNDKIKQALQPSKQRSAGRQQHLNNVPADTPGEYCSRSLFYPLVDYIAKEVEERIVIPKEKFLDQYLILSTLASLT